MLKENVGRLIYHPLGRIRFDENGVADWPMDPFTYRRMKDGDISLRPPAKTEIQDYGD